MSTEHVEYEHGESERSETGYGIGSVWNAIEALPDSASVDRVYGAPITRDGTTIVPVARVAYGFGGGFGAGETGGDGGGGGGGVTADPVGVLEITDDESRFVRFSSRKRLALAVGGGLLFGLLLGRQGGKD